MKKMEYKILKDYSRGSDDRTILCSGSTGLFFRKIATGKKNISKLRNQVDWIQNYSNKISLPCIDNIYVSELEMFYDMRFNKGKTFSEFICENNNAKQNISILGSILNDLENNLYFSNLQQKNSGNQLEKYIQEKIIDNYNSMIDNKQFSDILRYDYVIINGVCYPNIQMYDSIFKKSNLYNVFINDRCGEIHGDLTLENIIISSDEGEKYYLIDPNTNNNFHSVYLDYAKVLQSLHGKYELIRKKNSKVIVNKNNIIISYEKNASYDKMYLLYRQLLDSKFNYDQQKSIYYHEIVHWLRLYKYRNKHEPDKILLYYAVFLKILKDVYEMFEEEK